MTIEAMKQALEALVGYELVYGSDEKDREAVRALRQAIEQAEKQEPVAWQVHPFDYGIGHEGVYARTDRPEQVEMWKRKGWAVQPLYTTPQPQREWVGLTQKELDDLWDEHHDAYGYQLSADGYERAIEAKLKEKNT